VRDVHPGPRLRLVLGGNEGRVRRSAERVRGRRQLFLDVGARRLSRSRQRRRRGRHRL